MPNIILIGGGGHARACIDVIELNAKFNISGFIEKDGFEGKEIFGYPNIGRDNNLSVLREKNKYALIAIGQIKSPKPRIKFYKLLKEIGYSLPSIVSPRAHVSKYAIIEEGSIIMHYSIVSSNSNIGKNCIINNKVLIEHDVVIGNHCHVSTGAIINGGTVIGNNTFIGSGAIAKESIKIGNNCIIGAGAILKKDVKSNQIVYN